MGTLTTLSNIVGRPIGIYLAELPWFQSFQAFQAFEQLELLERLERLNVYEAYSSDQHSANIIPQGE